MNNLKLLSVDEMGHMLQEEKYKSYRNGLLEELRFRTQKPEVAKTLLEFEMKDYIKHPEQINFNRLYALMESYKDWRNQEIREIFNLPNLVLAS